MTYLESAALMNDFTFRGRIKVALLKYADSILIEPASTPGHSSRIRWAQGAFQQPEQAAQQIHPPTVMDVQVQADGVDIADGPLQTSVETVINKII